MGHRGDVEFRPSKLGRGTRQLSSFALMRLRVFVADGHLVPIEFFFDNVKGVVADLVAGAH